MRYSLLLSKKKKKKKIFTTTKYCIFKIKGDLQFKKKILKVNKPNFL